MSRSHRTRTPETLTLPHNQSNTTPPQRGGRLDMRYIQMNTGKGEVEPRITGVDMDATLAGPVGNKARACLA